MFNDLEKLYIYHIDNGFVGTIVRERNVYKFTYHKDYKSSAPFILPKNTMDIFEKDYTVDVNEKFVSVGRIFLTIEDNFPEGANLERMTNKAGFVPHEQPLRYLSKVKCDGTFEFLVEKKDG